MLFYCLGLEAVYQKKVDVKEKKKLVLYIFITALTCRFQILCFFFVCFFCQDTCSQKLKNIYYLLSFFKLLVSEATITDHVHFAQPFLVSIYCNLKKRVMLPHASLRAPHQVQFVLQCVEHLSCLFIPVS